MKKLIIFSMIILAPKAMAGIMISTYGNHDIEMVALY
jgi:hypothetical protein